MAKEKKQSNRWKIIINVITLLALAALVYAIRDEIMQTIKNLDDLKFFALILIIPAQVLSYHAYAEMYQGLFKILGHQMRYWHMYRLTLELNFVNQVFPSGGVTGISYFGVRMKEHGVTTGKSTLVQVMRFILLFISFQVLLLTGLLILAIGGQASNLAILIAGSIATFLVLSSLGLMFVLGSKQRINSFFVYITRIINRVIHIVRPNHPETINIQKVKDTFTELHENYLVLRHNPQVLKGPLFNALMTNIAEVLTIYVVYIAFGQWVNPGAIIIAYAVANFAGLISVLPGGVGIYEALMTGVLASVGVPAAVSIPVTLTYRVLSIALQIPVGYYFYHRAIHRRTAEL